MRSKPTNKWTKYSACRGRTSCWPGRTVWQRVTQWSALRSLAPNCITGNPQGRTINPLHLWGLTGNPQEDTDALNPLPMTVACHPTNNAKICRTQSKVFSVTRNKLASLEATLVRNSADLLAYLLTGVKCRATSVAKKVRKYVNVNMYIWNFFDRPTNPENETFGDMIWQEKALFWKIYYEGCLLFNRINRLIDFEVFLQLGCFSFIIQMVN